MKKNILKKFWIMTMIWLFSFIILPFKVNWADGDMDVDGFNIMPELKEEEISEVDMLDINIWLVLSLEVKFHLPQ